MADFEALLRRRRSPRRRRRYPPPKSAAQKRAAAESLVASGAGDVAKTAIGVAGRLRRQWLRWLTEHGEAYEYDAAKSLGGDEFTSRRERGE